VSQAADNEPAEPSRSRGRGRPRSGTATDTRERILTAARQQFADTGFDGTSLRAIATAAGVDASLISHYFGDKSGLLIATMQLPVNPIELIQGVLADGPEGLAERVLATFLTAWDAHREVFSGLVRTTIASADRSAPMLSVLRGVLLPSLVAVMPGADRELRGALFASQLIGMATLRYVLQVEPLAGAAPSEVIRWYAPGLQSLMTPGDLPRA
jgi:AcrR family transcriptional regulator